MICGLGSQWSGEGPGAESRTLEYSLACDTESLHAAFRLTHDQYVRRGYMAPHPSGRRLSLYHALPTTKVFVAQERGAVVGTISLLQDSRLGLPMEDLYAAEVARFRVQGRRICEVSALAMSPGDGQRSLVAVLGLIRMAELYAAEVARLDEIFISVNPRHVAFHQKFLGFEPIGPRRSYARVNGAPAEALRQDLGGLRRTILELHSGVGAATKPNAFMYGEERYRKAMASLYRDMGRSTLSREQFIHFFAGHEAFTGAPEPQRSYVLSLYPEPGPEAEPGPSQSSRPGLSAVGLVSAV
jgi:hypothetical protein